MENRRTIHYFQWMRALGAVVIVLLHAFVVIHTSAEPGELSELRLTIEEAIIVTCSRWAVPCFFMMSGALMLDPEREMGWGKALRHVWRMGFVLLTFGLGFCIIESAVKAGTLTIDVLLDAGYNLIVGRSWDHMWFVYLLLGFYLVTPVIRPWAAQASREEYGKVALVAAVLLLGTKCLSSEIKSTIYNFVGMPYCFAYYLMGPYVHRYLELNRRWVVLGLLSLATMLGLRIFVGWGWVGDPIRGLVAPYAILVFLLFKRYFDVPTEGHRLIGLLADYSFGIYLIHPAFQHAMVAYVNPVPYHPVLATTVLTIVPLALSIVFTWLLRRIPLFRDKV